MPYVLTALTGLLAGSGHVLSGPDHLAAVAPLAADQRARTWRVGLLWGIGHSGGVWILALVALLFRESLPLDWLSVWGERAVGFVLIGIGWIGLRRMIGTRIHSHLHEHGGVRHVHVHVHSSVSGARHPVTHHHSHSALGIGVLHGLAGTAHLLGVLPALLLPTRLEAFVYVVFFGLGSIVAMTAFSWIVGLVVGRFRGLGNRAFRWLLASCFLGTLVVGVYWCYASFGPSGVLS